MQVLRTEESTEGEASQRLALGSTLMARLKAVEALTVHSLDGTVEGTYSVLQIGSSPTGGDMMGAHPNYVGFKGGKGIPRTN